MLFTTEGTAGAAYVLLFPAFSFSVPENQTLVRGFSCTHRFQSLVQQQDERSLHPSNPQEASSNPGNVQSQVGVEATTELVSAYVSLQLATL